MKARGGTRHEGAAVMTHRLRNSSIFTILLAAALFIPAGVFGADSDAPGSAPPLEHKKLSPEESLRIRIMESQAGLRTNIAKAPHSETIVGPNLEDREKVEQAVNRMSFGARPGEIDAIINNGGWEAWAKQQLNPDSIDDSALDHQVAQRYPWTKMDIDKIHDTYYEEKDNRHILYEGLTDSVLYRAVFSKREFKEMVVDFWRNHFAIDQPHDSDKSRSWSAVDYEENVIRKYAFGKFKQMLFASATHPAMLEYLDQQLSKKGEWNENYAREVMELHTLGADRGYTDKDVQELSKVLTGWRYNDSYHFAFDPSWQQPGNKYWLGMTIPEGYKGGEKALYTLATHKNTAEFISMKLVRYFVNDNPPDALVKRVATVFHDSEGDLPQVYAAIIFSPEFMSRQNYRAKFKTPLQFAVSSLRATDAKIDSLKSTAETITRMGEEIYNCADPTGYRDVAESWMDAGVLTKRWDYAWALMRGGVGGVSVPQSFIDHYNSMKPEDMEARIIEDLVGGEVGDREIKSLQAAAADKDKSRMVSIILGGPSFQQR
jgi:uncharacterized protein (DUF1800 family)